MFKKLFIGAFLLALALSSCAPAVQAVETWIYYGVEEAMNRHN